MLYAYVQKRRLPASAYAGLSELLRAFFRLHALEHLQIVCLRVHAQAVLPTLCCLHPHACMRMDVRTCIHKVQGQALSQRDKVAQNAAEQGRACCNLLSVGILCPVGSSVASDTAPRALCLVHLTPCASPMPSGDALPHQDLSFQCNCHKSVHSSKKSLQHLQGSCTYSSSRDSQAWDGGNGGPPC